MSDEDFIKALAVNLDEQFDAGILEPFDGFLFTRILERVVPYIPPRYREIMLSLSDGISDQEIDQVREWLWNLLSSNIPTFFFSEEFKRKIFDMVIDEIVKYLRPQIMLTMPEQ